MADAKKSDNQTDTQEKLPYTKPELQSFGTIADLVKTVGGGGTPDGGIFPDDNQS